MALIKDIIKNYEGMTDDEKAEFAELDYKSPEDISGLEGKRTELLGQNKKLRDKLKISTELSEESKNLLDILENNSILESGDLESLLSAKGGDEKITQENSRLNKALETFKSKTEELTTENETLKQARVTDKVGRVIDKELNKHTFVSGKLRELISKEFLGKAQAEKLGDGKLSIIDSTDGVTPISDSIESWSKTDEAKNFLKAPDNTGGGSGGGKGGTGGKLTLEQISKITNRSDRLKAMEDNGL